MKVEFMMEKNVQLFFIKPRVKFIKTTTKIKKRRINTYAGWIYALNFSNLDMQKRANKKKRKKQEQT